MNNRPDRRRTQNDAPIQPLTGDERLEDYLEHLGAPLVGIVPFRERKAFRREVQAHLEGLIDEYVWQGNERAAATEAALREFGEPWKVGQAFVQEWLQGSVHLRPAPLVRKATCTSFVWFGIGSLLVLLPLERDALIGPWAEGLSGAGLLAMVAPVVAGVLTGATTPLQAKTGVRNAMFALALHTFVLGLLLLPRYEGLVFAAWQVVFWLPVGVMTAAVTARIVRQFRRQQFWQVSRT